MAFLEFEKPIAELEGKITELRQLSSGDKLNLASEVKKLEGKLAKLLAETYARLTPAQKVQVARHPQRPHCRDYIEALIEDFTPLAGDRAYADDAAIMGGLGRFRGINCLIIGQEKGFDTESRIKHNFGMAKPDGYRKAIRLMELAGRFGLPIISFVDTAGAFPGIDAEARGQAEAIARSIDACLKAPVPFVASVIGEGGSGGAIAIAAGDRVLMLEHAIYSVISPEGCASILWRSATHAAEAAQALKLTAQDLLKLGVIDSIVPEPLGGAHRGVRETVTALADRIEQQLRELLPLSSVSLIERRRQKYLTMGSKGL